MTTLEFFLQRIESAVKEDIRISIDNGVQLENTKTLIATNEDRNYVITVVDETVVGCSCQDHYYRGQKLGQIGACKHMIRASIEFNLNL